MPPPWPIAAPSCVIPASVAENARFLSGRVEEIGICLFEAQSSLDYSGADMPLWLADLPLRWHVHLPLDLPWEAGGAAAAALALAVSQQTRFLQPRLAVLHPPKVSAKAHEQQADLLRAYARMWKTYSDLPLLLENIEDCSLLFLPPDIFDLFGVCLDVGHLLFHEQLDLLQRPDILARVALVHWAAPGKDISRHQHLPLTQLGTEHTHLAQKIARLVPHDALHMLEIFHWAGVEQSYPVLQTLLES